MESYQNAFFYSLSFICASFRPILWDLIAETILYDEQATLQRRDRGKWLRPYDTRLLKSQDLQWKGSILFCPTKGFVLHLTEDNMKHGSYRNNVCHSYHWKVFRNFYMISVCAQWLNWCHICRAICRMHCGGYARQKRLSRIPPVELSGERH